MLFNCLISSLVQLLYTLLSLLLVICLTSCLCQLDCFAGEFLELWGKLIEVVVNYLQFGEDLGPLQFVDLVTEVVGSSIGLDSQLQLCNNLFPDGYLESHITDRHWIAKPVFNFNDPKTRFFSFLLANFLFFLNEGLDCLN